MITVVPIPRDFKPTKGRRRSLANRKSSFKGRRIRTKSSINDTAVLHQTTAQFCFILTMSTAGCDCIQPIIPQVDPLTGIATVVAICCICFAAVFAIIYALETFLPPLPLRMFVSRLLLMAKTVTRPHPPR